MTDTLETTNLDLPDTIHHAGQHPAVVYLSSLAPGSRPTMRGALDTIATLITGEDGTSFHDIPWHRLRFQHTTAIRALLAERYAHSTTNKILSALRGVLKAAWRLGLMTSEEYHKAAGVENVKGQTLPAGRAVALGELSALLDGCEQKPKGVRDAAILSLLYGCGLRRAELVALDFKDYIKEESSLRVRGKGNKERLVPVVGNVALALRDWLTIRGMRPGPLFWGLGNRNRGGRLTTQAIYKMLQTRARAAGIENLSPHDFRRTFVGDLLDRGADLATVQKLAGHADVTTTARYDRRGERAKRDAAELLHVPYTRRQLPVVDPSAD